MESLIHHFMVEMPGHGIKHARSARPTTPPRAPNGELGWHLATPTGPGSPTSVRCRPPSIYQFQAMPHMCRRSPDRRRRGQHELPERDRRGARPLRRTMTASLPIADDDPGPHLQRSGGGRAGASGRSSSIPTKQAVAAARPCASSSDEFGCGRSGRHEARRPASSTWPRPTSWASSPSTPTTGSPTDGTFVIEVCRTLPCALRGSDEFAASTPAEKLGIKVGQTTADGLFTLKNAECLAACDKAPMCHVNAYAWELLDPGVLRPAGRRRSARTPRASTSRPVARQPHPWTGGRRPPGPADGKPEGEKRLRARRPDPRADPHEALLHRGLDERYADYVARTAATSLAQEGSQA